MQREFTANAERTATRKAAIRIIPLLVVMYIVAFMDRSNISYIKMDIGRDIGIGGAAFGLGAGLFFIGYFLFEIPSNLVLVRVGARVWLARIMVSWGLVAAATAFVRGDWSFYAMRFLLGACEAGFFPGVIFYVSLWFPLTMRARVLGLFYFGFPLAMILNGPISGFLMRSTAFAGLWGWQSMLLIEGIFAIGIGLIVWRYLPPSPDQASWLRRDESDALLAATAESGPGTHRPTLAMLVSAPVLRWSLIYFLIQAGVYGVVFYLPSRIAAAMHREVDATVGLWGSLPWLAALLCAWGMPRLADRHRMHGRLSAILLALAASGAMASAFATTLPAVLAAYAVALGGLVAAQPLFWTLSTQRMRGLASASMIAAINSLGNLGGFVAPNLREFLDHALASSAAGALGLALCPALAAVLLLVSSWRPARQTPFHAHALEDAS